MAKMQVISWLYFHIIGGKPPTQDRGFYRHNTDGCAADTGYGNYFVLR